MTQVQNHAAGVLLERRAAIARLVINRPPLNILDLETLRTLRARWSEAAGVDGVRLVEFRGAGSQAFSAGTDVRDHFPERAPEMLSEFHALIRAVLDSSVLTLAIVEGQCLGGGMELALACDFILASEEARFALPEIKLGAFPPVAAALLPHLIGEKKALELILTGEALTAADACRLGLVTRVVAARQLDAEVESFSAGLLAQSAQIIPLARRATRLAWRGSFEAALREAERIYLDELLSTEDAAEGLRAFLEKRRPNWAR